MDPNVEDPEVELETSDVVSGLDVAGKLSRTGRLNAGIREPDVVDEFGSTGGSSATETEMV